MSGIGGISGFGGMNPAAWIGMSGLAGAANVSGSGITAQAGSVSVGAMNLAPNMQGVVEALKQFSTAEILFALMMASRHGDQQQVSGCSDSILEGMAAAALIGQQMPVMSVQFESVAATATSLGASLNVQM